jgi:diaminohydroxyphosphoribosylaminopyrimidine deaminase / 5-amino-6-(5-phosphoribosylamino)uracil reductase
MKKGALITPKEAQELALHEARKGAGFVSPNPLVGCVIVDAQHNFLSSGFHAKLGGDHAEVDALKQVSREELKGATVYVTLEPCAHVGRTPSCAARLAEEPIAKVVAALLDPNPLVAGKGFAILNAKGIATEVDGEFGEKAKYICEEFLFHITKKRPFIALKVAVSLDGQMALKSGESQWITGEESRLAARRLRGVHDATLIGAGTLIKDNPLLDFRGTEFEGKKNNRVVIWDPKNVARDFLPAAKLSKTIPPENIIVITAPELTEDIFEGLYKNGIHSLYVEGGAYVLSEMVRTKCFQKLYYFLAPSLLGNGLGWTGHLDIGDMSEKVLLSFHDVEKIGTDLLVTAYPKNL